MKSNAEGRDWKKINKKKLKQIAIIRMMTQFNTKTKWEDTFQF
jgi:hypothetical protein